MCYKVLRGLVRVCSVFKTYFTVENFDYRIFGAIDHIVELYQFQKMEAEWKIIGKGDRKAVFASWGKPNQTTSSTSLSSFLQEGTFGGSNPLEVGLKLWSLSSENCPPFMWVLSSLKAPDTPRVNNNVSIFFQYTFFTNLAFFNMLIAKVLR